MTRLTDALTEHFLPTQDGVHKDWSFSVQNNSCNLMLAVSEDQCIESTLLQCKFDCSLLIEHLPGVARCQNYESYRLLGTTLIIL
jgi:hypothetical protein